MVHNRNYVVLLSFLSLLFLQSSSSSYDRRDGKIVSVFVPVYHPFLFSTVHQQISVAVNFFLSFLPSRPEPHPSSRTFFCFNLAFLIFYSPSLSRFLSLSTGSSSMPRASGFTHWTRRILLANPPSLPTPHASPLMTSTQGTEWLSRNDSVCCSQIHQQCRCNGGARRSHARARTHHNPHARTYTHARAHVHTRDSPTTTAILDKI